MAEVLNNFFSSVFTKEDTESIPQPKKINTTSRFNDIHITEADLIKYIQKLKHIKSPGPDGIHPKILKEHQHGFLPGRSTIRQLLQAMDYWTEALDNGSDIDILYLDFQKAFDSVPHQRLLAKLESYSIGGNVYNWLEFFLLNRRQRVLVNNSSSSWSDVLNGIPQGSVMGQCCSPFS